MGLELTEAVFGERSSERREFCKGEGESESDLATPLLSLLTRGVAGDAFLGVSDIIAEDLFNFKLSAPYPYYIKQNNADII